MFIIIDMINDFVKSDGALYVPGAEKLIGTINEKLTWHMSKGDIIIMLTDNHSPTDKEFEILQIPHAIQSTIGAEIVDGFDTKKLFGSYWHEGKYFHVGKTTYNGFYKTELGDICKREYNPYKPRPVEVAGVCTSICIMDTVSWLSFMGYSITIDKRCILDLTKEDHEYAIKRMERLYGVNFV